MYPNQETERQSTGKGSDPNRGRGMPENRDVKLQALGGGDHELGLGSRSGPGGWDRGCRGGQRDMKMDGVCWEQVGGG